MNPISETDLGVTASREAPWHELGTVVKDAKDSATAVQLAGLDWEVHQAPVRYFDGTQERVVDSLKVNYRADTGEPLGIVTNTYTVVQNRTVFEFTERLLGEGLQYESLGTIQDGRSVWLQASLPGTEILGDTFRPNLLFTNGHDGQSAVRVYVTPIRVACTNVFNIAIRGAFQKWHLPHVRTVREKMINAKLVFARVDDYMDDLNWRADSLASAKLGQNDIRRFIEKMFPAEDTIRKNNRVKREIERFRDCYFMNDLENFKGTKWGLLLAASDYVTHKPVRTKREREGHFLRMIEGHELLGKAYTLIDML